MNPLEEAMNKLLEYMEGNNPKHRRLMTEEIFGYFDQDKSGIVTRSEFLGGLDSLGLNIDE